MDTRTHYVGAEAGGYEGFRVEARRAETLNPECPPAGATATYELRPATDPPHCTAHRTAPHRNYYNVPEIYVKFPPPTP